MQYLKLGEILIKQGLITEEQIQKAINRQKTEKGRIGEILVKLDIITEEDIAFALGSQLGIPYYSSENPGLLVPRSDQGLEKLVPLDFAQKNTVLPLSKNFNSLTCVVSDPLDLLLLDNLKRITKHEINLVVAPQTAIQNVINAFYFNSSQGGEAKPSLLSDAVQQSYQDDDNTLNPSAQKKDGGTELSLDKLIAKAEEAPVIKLVDLIIRQAIDERASDIHIEPFENKIHLRYRIDGHLYSLPPPAPHLHLPMVSRIKILCKLDIAEKRLPQDGALSAKLEDRTVDLRISTIPTVWGEKVVMRILDKGAVPLDLAKLGFNTKQIDSLRKALASPYGLFFVTGPTGSGKSTTLYAAVNETVDPTKNLLTVEDPVEYKIEGINQVAVKSEIGLTFATAPRAFLRQDPDIIMVGEVRDNDTATLVIHAALTGHIVLSTLHTNNAFGIIPRLVDMGVEGFLLSSTLNVVIAQRLVRKLHEDSKKKYFLITMMRQKCPGL